MLNVRNVGECRLVRLPKNVVVFDGADQFYGDVGLVRLSDLKPVFLEKETEACGMCFTRADYIRDAQRIEINIGSAKSLDDCSTVSVSPYIKRVSRAKVFNFEHNVIKVGEVEVKLLKSYGLHGDSSALPFLHHLDLIEGRICALLSGGHGLVQNFGLICHLSKLARDVLSLHVHQMSLVFNRPQSFEGSPTSNATYDTKHPIRDVCRGQQFLPWIAGRLLIGLTLLFGGGELYLSGRRRWMNQLGLRCFLLGWLILLATAPWGLGPCQVRAPQNQQSEYRQTFEHDGENVSQIHVDRSWDPMRRSLCMQTPKFLTRTVGVVWEKWPPGVCIAALALDAAIFPIVTPSELTSVDKAKWMTGLGFLLVLELVIIFKERRSQDRAYAADRERQDKAHIEQLRQIEEMRAASDSRTASMIRLAMAINDPVEGLKKRALQLSDSILEFIYSRMQAAPPEEPMFVSYNLIQTESTFPLINSYVNKSLAYQADTVKFYESRFPEKVGSILAEFAEKEVVDDWLNGLCATAKSDWSIRMIGERIGALAELLTPA